jgi:rRNA processing protein Krr1/Pno1
MAASDEDESPIDIVTIIVGCFIGVLVWSVISYIGGSSKKQSKQSQSQKQQPKQAAKPSKKEQKKQQANQPKKAVHSTYVPEPPKKKPTGDISNLGEMVTLSSRGAAAAIGATHTIDPFEVDDGGWNDVVKKEKKKKPKPSGGAGGPHAPFMPDDGPKEKIVFNTLQRLPAGKYQVNIQLNRESVLTVIGKGGMTIKNLRQKTNAEIQIDRLNEVCEITGKDTQVKKAQHAIQLLISSQAKTTIELGQHVPAIIGKGGEVIKAIRARSGAQLDIDKLTNCCDLSGTKDQVAKAQMLIEEIIGRANAAIADHTSDLIMVEPGHIPLIIGKGGLTIRAFQERSGARFDIDRNSSEITISGSSAQVATAKQMIEEHIDANSHSYVFLLGDDSQKKMAILGKKVGVGNERAGHSTVVTCE